MRSVSLATKAEWLAASPVQPSVTPGVNSFVVRYSVDAASRVLSELHAQFPAPKLQHKANLQAQRLRLRRANNPRFNRGQKANVAQCNRWLRGEKGINGGHLMYILWRF